MGVLCRACTVFYVSFFGLTVVFFSDLSVCSYRVPEVSTASFYIDSLFSAQFAPGQDSVVYLSHSFGSDVTFFDDRVSASISESLCVASSSIPDVSSGDDSFPSRSIFDNSSGSASDFALLLQHECVEVSFSVRLSTCITDFVFFSKLGIFVPFVEPVIPVSVESSARAPIFSGFFTECAADLELYSVDYFFTYSFSVTAFLSADTVERRFSSSISDKNNDASIPPVWGASFIYNLLPRDVFRAHFVAGGDFVRGRVVYVILGWAVQYSSRRRVVWGRLAVSLRSYRLVGFARFGTSAVVSRTLMQRVGGTSVFSCGVGRYAPTCIRQGLL